MLERELRVARAAVAEAGAAVMQLYGDVVRESKAGDEPVTRADHAANATILEHLRREFPADAILSEESVDDRSRLDSERVWIVDPLDGTKEFLDQNGEFAVMVGLAIGGRAVLGVVGAPALGRTWHAHEGGGVWVSGDGDEPERILPVEPDGDGASIRAVGSRSHADALTMRMLERAGVRDVAPCGSVGVKCARILEAERDLYIHPVPYLREWDTCAPEIIAREAGARVTDCRGRALRYNKPDPRHPDGILVAGPRVPEAVVLSAIAEYREAKAGDA